MGGPRAGLDSTGKRKFLEKIKPKFLSQRHSQSPSPGNYVLTADNDDHEDECLLGLDTM
jgi:hypothetical protein